MMSGGTGSCENEETISTEGDRGGVSYNWVYGGTHPVMSIDDKLLSESDTRIGCGEACNWVYGKRT
jgi:hypothetical protein